VELGRLVVLVRVCAVMVMTGLLRCSDIVWGSSLCGLSRVLVAYESETKDCVVKSQSKHKMNISIVP
jgi:hypothetical protein